MLLPYCARLRSSGVRIVLASTSPRRRDLMALLLPAAGGAATTVTATVGSGAEAGGVPFVCVPSSFAEDLPHSAHATAASYAQATCGAKAAEVWARVAQDTDLLIAADTVVVRDGVILEKPQCQATRRSQRTLLPALAAA
jgi:predicted house-cleaning NTP pyrophosphatase (Maf/HAM1 superfamily)